MGANKNSVPAAARVAKIREMLSQRPSVSISELARLFNVTEMTIHRDLGRLEAANQVRKTHGGVVPAQGMIFEFDFAARRAENLKAKQAIARYAVRFVKSSSRLIIDTGTTTLELASLIKDFSDLTVITPSLAVASVLQFSGGIQTILLGGILCQGRPDLTGSVTETMLDMFAADIAFQGADAIGPDGTLYNADMRIAHVDCKIRQRAHQTYILCDSSKIGKTALAGAGSLREVNALITDDKIDPSIRKVYEKMHARVITVPC